MDKINIWAEILENLLDDIDKNTLSVYFKDVTLDSIDDQIKIFTLKANDEFLAGSLMTSFKTFIENAMEKIIGVRYTLTKVNIVNTTIKKNDKFMKNSVFRGDNLSPSYLFENYHMTNSNKDALLQAKYLVKTYKNSDSFFPILFHGSSGVGKTHLVSAIGNEIKRIYPDDNIKYLTSNEFLNLYVDAVNNSNNEIKKMSDYFENLDLLILEDFQFLSNKEKTEEQFFYTFEALRKKGAKLVLTSDASPNNLVGIQKRLLTRLESGIFIELQTLDYDSRLILIQNKIKEFKNVEFEDGVDELISQIDTDNVRSLEGWLTTAVAKSITQMSEEGKTKITVEFVSEILKVKKIKVHKKITYKKIIRACSQFYQITEQDILSAKRNKDVALARNVAIYLIRNLLSLTYKDIASIFNRKDHTTIINSIKRINNLKSTTSVEIDIGSIKKSL